MSGKAWAREHLFRLRGHDARPSLGQWLQDLVPGRPWTSGEFTLVPLTLAENPARRDLLLPEALARGTMEVVEQGSGVVHRLVARNRGTEDVLVLEGDTLIGARQNRMVAWSVLVAAGGTAPVSAGCMERGRWSSGGPGFKAGEMAVDPHLRRRTKRETNASAAGPDGPRLDQGRAWHDVDGRLRQWSVASESADYHSGLRARSVEARRNVREIAPDAGQVGVLALCRGRLLGIEAVGHSETWRVLASRVLPSYALGAEAAQLDPEFRRLPERGGAGDWLQTVAAATMQERRAAGKGVDLVLSGDWVAGSCLWEAGTVKHLAVFPTG
jgi:hypothetical protein